LAALLALTRMDLSALLGWSAAGGAVHAIWLWRCLHRLASGKLPERIDGPIVLALTFILWFWPAAAHRVGKRLRPMTARQARPAGDSHGRLLGRGLLRVDHFSAGAFRSATPGLRLARVFASKSVRSTTLFVPPRQAHLRASSPWRSRRLRPSISMVCVDFGYAALIWSSFKIT